MCVHCFVMTSAESSVVQKNLSEYYVDMFYKC